MSTFAELKTALSDRLRDPGRDTFDETAVADMLNSALVVIGRLAPERFLEVITPVADTLSYQLRSAGEDTAVTGVAATDLLTSVSHGLKAGSGIKFVTLTGGAGLALNFPYYVIADGLTADAFKVATTVAGSAVNFTTDVTAGTWRRLGSDSPIPEIEVMRVEVWDGSVTPATQVARLRPAAGEYENNSQVGWEVWDGVLYLTSGTEAYLDPAKHIIKVWGYSPYLPLFTDEQVVPVSRNLETAMLDYCRVEALRRLVNERDLFTQWQTRSNNTDVSPAGLMNGLAQAEEAWRRQRSELVVLRRGS